MILLVRYVQSDLGVCCWVTLLMRKILHFSLEEFSPKYEFRIEIMVFFSRVFFQWKITLCVKGHKSMFSSLSSHCLDFQ